MMPRLLTLTAALALSTSAALAAPGDIHRVTAELVNLRAGPSDDANVRSQLPQSEQVIELRRDGNWVGVRSLRTGEEGWIFGRLLEPVALSTLSGGIPPVTAGFGELSQSFDRLVGWMDLRRGFSMVDSVRSVDGSTLEVVAKPDWLRAASEEEHLLATVAIYEMWKNHQNSAPVSVVLIEATGERYIVIDDANGAIPLVSRVNASG
jgi:uncharacterized protein YgiM (DUF1202 family)